MAKGKYSEVLPDLPQTFGTEPKYQELVEALKVRMAEEVGMSASKLTARYASLRAAKEALEDEIKGLNLHIEATSQLLADAFEEEGITSLTTTDGTLRIQPEPYPTVKDPDAVRQWALANGLERKMTLPWKTLEGLVKQRLLEGMEDIPGVKTFSKTKFVFSRGR